jgi:DNA-directed RNA polymerase subunit RPC12/RpoP
MTDQRSTDRSGGFAQAGRGDGARDEGLPAGVPTGQPGDPDLPGVGVRAGDAGASEGHDEPLAPAGPLVVRHSVQRFPCGQCGARLEFKPGTRSLVCRYCGHSNQVASEPDGNSPAGQPEELDYEAYAQLRDDVAEATQAQVFTCQSCNASVTKPGHIAAGSCPYCASNIVATSVAKRVIKPNAVLPFAVPKDAAITAFRQWLASRWFAPNALKRQGKLDAGVRGVYVPYWTFDARTVTSYRGQRGDAYYVTVRSGNSTQRVRKIRWSSASGVVENNFDDILILAGNGLSNAEAERLTPWKLKDCVAYDDAYLAGYTAESYSVPLPQGFAQAKGVMAGVIEQSVRADIGGDEQRITQMSASYYDVTFKHVLLPVWITAYRYMNKVYHVLVNAQTAEVTGQRPYSVWKITGFVLLCIAAILIVVLIARVAGAG